MPEEVIDYAEETRVKEVQPPLPTEEQKTSTQQQRQQQQQQQQLMQSIQQSSKFDHSASNRVMVQLSGKIRKINSKVIMNSSK